MSIKPHHLRKYVNAGEQMFRGKTRIGVNPSLSDRDAAWDYFATKTLSRRERRTIAKLVRKEARA